MKTVETGAILPENIYSINVAFFQSHRFNKTLLIWNWLRRSSFFLVIGEIYEAVRLHHFNK
jgi:hypothetical protein